MCNRFIYVPLDSRNMPHIDKTLYENSQPFPVNGSQGYTLHRVLYLGCDIALGFSSVPNSCDL